MALQTTCHQIKQLYKKRIFNNVSTIYCYHTKSGVYGYKPNVNDSNPGNGTLQRRYYN